MLPFSLVFMLQEWGPRQNTPLMADIIKFGVGNSTILNQDGKTKILSHVACFYSKCLAKMKNERPAWQCFLTITINFKITSFTRLLVALKLLYLFWWQVMTSRDRVINADFVLFSCRLQTMCYLTKKKILPAKSRPSWLKWVCFVFCLFKGE